MPNVSTFQSLFAVLFDMSKFSDFYAEKVKIDASTGSLNFNKEFFRILKLQRSIVRFGFGHARKRLNQSRVNLQEKFRNG